MTGGEEAGQYTCKRDGKLMKTMEEERTGKIRDDRKALKRIHCSHLL